MTTTVARDPVESFAAIGVTAFTTTRDAGDFGIPQTGVNEAAREKWEELLRELAPAARLASSRQVHGNRVITHGGDWSGWRRIESADGHVTTTKGTVLAVSVADCVPVFLAHGSGAVGVLHAGWRGVVAKILDHGLDAMEALGAPADEVHVHLGPCISGRSYEVGPDVYAQLTGWETQRPRRVDLRAILAEQARTRGVQHLSASHWCTMENNDRFFSHRAGNGERQLAVIVSS
ncbi:MAG TPA: polyphenol oxidase family protein [Gemmatimonadaceae bacterium]|nr:polyphenol oxidase family protein [Gemmatimonadaceae bacterium]